MMVLFCEWNRHTKSWAGFCGDWITDLLIAARDRLFRAYPGTFTAFPHSSHTNAISRENPGAR